MVAIQSPDWSKLSSLDPELTRAFVTAAECGSFTAAARQLHRAQSTISLRIRMLEERLGTHLFMRNSQRLELSNDGETFLIHMRRIIRVQNESIDALRQVRSRPEIVRLGLPEDYAELWLPDLLKSMNRLRPGVHLHVHCRTSLELLERLKTGELDAALVARHGSTAGGHHLGYGDVVWAAHRDFVFDRHASVPLALVSEKCCYRMLGLQALAAIKRPYQVTCTSQSLTAIKIAVDHGTAATVFGRCALPKNWRVLGEPEGLPSLPPVALELHRPSRNIDPAIDALMPLLKSLIAERDSQSIVEGVDPVG